MFASRAARVRSTDPTVGSVPFGRGGRIRQSQKEERPARSRTSASVRPSPSCLFPRRSAQNTKRGRERERQIDELSARRTADFKTERGQRRRCSYRTNGAHFKTSERQWKWPDGRDGRTEERGFRPVRQSERGERVKCPKSMQISPTQLASNAASDRATERPVCGLSQEFDCNLRMVNSE